MSPMPEVCLEMLDEANLNSESFTYLVVAGGTCESVLSALGADPDRIDLNDVDFGEFSAYAVAEVDGGVIAIEHSGYADPSPETLRLLSVDEGAAAVARSNIQAHERFGCARDGVLVFDAHEYTFVEPEDKARVPADLAVLFESAWIDPGDDIDAEGDELGGVLTAMAMATVFTGVSASAQDLQRARAGGYHRVRTLAYLE